jgi:hypothetical protein
VALTTYFNLILRLKNINLLSLHFFTYTDLSSWRRPVGKTSRRQIDKVDRDKKRVSEHKDWRRSAEDRDVWSRRIEELGCMATGKEEDLSSYTAPLLELHNYQMYIAWTAP